MMEIMPHEPAGEEKRGRCSSGVISAFAFSGDLCCDSAATLGAELNSFPGKGCAVSPVPSSQVQQHLMPFGSSCISQRLIRYLNGSRRI